MNDCLAATNITENRLYRKSLCTHGLIYLGGEEMPFKVVNLSLSGLLLELADHQSARSVKDIFKALQVSPRVDIYLPDMRVAGEAAVVRVEALPQTLSIAVEFLSLSYDIDHLLYQRHAYRKAMNVPGELFIDGIAYEFTTQNVSVEGFMARIEGLLTVELASCLRFDFQTLDLSGEVEVIWQEQDEHSTLLGLKYLHLQRDSIPGVPRFVR